MENLLILALMLATIKSLLFKERLLTEYSYPVVNFSSSKNYLIGEIVFVGDARYFCYNQDKCSGSSNSPPSSSGWKLLQPNEAVDLSQDDYERNGSYDKDDEVILHQSTWRCISDAFCDSDQNNPVGPDGSKAWALVAQNLSTLTHQWVSFLLFFIMF